MRRGTADIQNIPTAVISRVRFGHLTEDDIRADATVMITTSDLYRQELPQPQGLADRHLGPVDYHYRCDTCRDSKEKCLGHTGFIELNYPVFSPVVIKEIKIWLKIICHNCAGPIIPDAELMQIAPSKRIAYIVGRSKSTQKQAQIKCPHCHLDHPDVTSEKKEPLKLLASVRDGRPRILLPHIVAGVFHKITNETVIRLGRDPAAHPRNFVTRTILVPPVNLRPDSKRGGGKSTPDQITLKLQSLLKKSREIPSIIPNEISPKLEKPIFELLEYYYSLVRESGGEPNAKSLASSLKGKSGLHRQTQLGKRVFNMIRSIIVGNVSIPIDSIIVPISVAQTVSIMEVVQEYNKERLYVYVRNGRRQYPGALRVIKGTREYDIEKTKNIILEAGDIVVRNLLTGDIVNFNRQPSLMASNISGMRVIVNHDVNNKTLMMNPIACPWFNADFDGDAMNCIVQSTAAGRNELEQLSSAHNWTISQSSSVPAVGLTEDSIVGTAMMTRTTSRYDKYHALLLFQNTTMVPRIDIAAGATISGREVVTLVLPQISYSRPPLYYVPEYTRWIRYDPADIKVNIDRGKVLIGILDKKAIGKGANGGIFHIIAAEYGTRTALEVMFNMQQLANGHIFQEGLTIGIKDMLVMLGAKAEIDEIASQALAKSHMIAEKLRTGDIIPPIGKTREQFYEEQQINTLTYLDEFRAPILSACDPMMNNLFVLLAYGSKGSFENMLNMVSICGQKLINGERTRQRFGPNRTMPYYTRNDLSPAARGYIAASYLGGMTAAEFVHNASAARFDLISKALTTSVTGDQNRKAIKNFESILVTNTRMMAKSSAVLELAYGEDYLDPRRLEVVKFPTIMLNNAKLADDYGTAEFPEELEQLRRDRDWFRAQFSAVEQMNTKEQLKPDRFMPVHVERVVSDAIKAYAGEDVATPKFIADTVRDAIEALPYILLNRIQKAARAKIPDHISVACRLLQVLARSFLTVKHLHARKCTETALRAALERIELKYSMSLIAPGTCVGVIAAQSFSEPLTQYMLDAHRRSAAGGTSKSALNRVKEILRAAYIDPTNDNSVMYIRLDDETASSRDRAQLLANSLEIMTLRNFTTSWQIFFEKFGEPTHPQYTAEAQFIADYVSKNVITRPPSDLVKWCVRFVINKTNLVLKNMSMETLMVRLQNAYPEMYFVYSQENALQTILRGYFRTNFFKESTAKNIREFVTRDMFARPIRGVPGIRSATVITSFAHRHGADGAFERKETFAITTLGTNLAGVAVVPGVHPNNIGTDAVQEIARVFGIEAARQKIAIELRNCMDSCNFRHYMTYANEMTYTGKVTSIESGGLKQREAANVLLRMGFTYPMRALEEATINNMVDTINGITGQLIIGSTPKVGTLYNECLLDQDYITKNTKGVEDILGQFL